MKSPDPQLAASAETVLCTPNRTYSLRQVHTSNSLYIAAPNASAASEPGSIPQSGIKTISKLGSTLEILPSSETSATPILSQALPVFAGLDDLDLTTSYSSRSKAAIFEDVPFSEGECEQAWIDLVAFQSSLDHDGPLRGFRPSASVSCKAWKAMLLVATENSINLTASIPSVYNQMLIEGAEEYPKELVKAILRRLSVGPQQSSIEIDQARTTQWTGLTLLESLWRDFEAVRKNDFIEKWKDALPEAWREGASLSVLGVSQKQLLRSDKANSMQDACKASADGKTLEYVPEDSRTVAKAATEAKPAAKTTSKRKWHEKFAQARKR